MDFFKKDEMINALKRIFQPGDVFEIRALDAQTNAYSRPHTVSGYFDYDHIEDAAQKIAQNLSFARGIYYTPNPVEPALLARAANRLRDMGQRDPSTADKDIPRRRWLLIDCDAVRPSGISSSDAEHEAAAAKAQEIKAGFASMGFPEPVVIDSGNGAQLMYRVDLPGGTEDTLCKAILQKLQACNTEQVSIDETVFNAARIWRLPGSMNCKGDAIPERPHRTAHILNFPEQLETVPDDLLRQAAGMTEEQTYVQEEFEASDDSSGVDMSGILDGMPEQSVEPFDLEQWIAKYAPDAEGPQPWQDGRKWIFPVCPFNSEHANRSAVITQQASGAIGFKCHHNGCRDNDWHALRKLREPGYAERITQSAIQSEYVSPSIAVEEEVAPEEQVTPDPAPWRDIKTEQIEAVLNGTLLGEMSNLYASVTVPRLPIEASLLKAIVTAGCALSGAGVPDVANQGLLPPIGALRARLRIDTAGGQVCNVYALLAANSASGKDIGNLLDTVTTSRSWSLGTSGSAEGIAEALKECPNGLISISEFMNWLDERHWQHKATSFLTEAFSKGFFKHNFSSRGGKVGTSKCDYCYPNIIANIQPDVFEDVVRSTDISSGFMGRFIYAKMPEFFGDPAKIDMTRILQDFNSIITAFEKKHGVVDVPDGYGTELSEMFKKYSPEKLHPVWRRLVNEYLPRFAVMLSITHQIRTQAEYVELEDEAWAGAKKMVLWFFTQAEELLSPIEDETLQARIQEKIMKRLASVIAHYDKGDGVSQRVISQHSSHTGTDAESRRKILCEMVERGWITTTESGCSRGAKMRISNIPPGVL